MSSDPPSVQVFTLGAFRVVVHGRVVQDQAWRRKTARQLFKILISRPSRRMTRDEVVELLWPESDPEAASSNLRSTLHAMRRALDPSEPASGLGFGPGPGPGPGPGQSLVFGDRDSIWLRPDAELWIDADAFQQTVVHATRAADPLPVLQQASVSYVGDYLPDDLYEDWAIERRDALRQLWVNLQFEVAEQLQMRGQPEAAVGELQRLVVSDRCDERAAQELMRVLIQLRRRSDALRVYQNLEQALRDELGVEPAERTRDLQRLAIASDASGGSRRAVFHCSYTFPEPKQLIGREAELERLQSILDGGRTTGQLVLLSAPAGTGKSTLAGALVKKARRSGFLCLAGAAYDERSSVPLAAFQEAFTDYVLAASANPVDPGVSSATSELADAVRELRHHPSVSGSARLDASAERSRLFAALLALVRTLAERGPVLVCLEDLHIADEATLHLLHYLVRQTRRAPVVFLGTFRTEALQSGEPISQVVAALIRERLAEHVELPALDQSATDRLVAVLVDGPVSSSLSASVYASTEGNPLFVEQLVLALRDDGRLDRAGTLRQPAVDDLSAVPVVVRELIGERLSRLSARSRQTLETAAVLGQTFDYADLLAVVEPIDEATLLTDLDEAIRAQLLRERPNGFAFSHALMRDGVYWGLSRPRRMLLHGRAGEVLERRAGDRAFNLAATLAHHFGSAGIAEPTQTKALHYSLRAGRGAAALDSNREALRHFTSACGLLERRVGDHIDAATYLVALEGRGLAERGMGMWQACIKTFHQVLKRATERTQRAQARQVISFALNHLGNTRGALGQAEMGLAELGARSEDLETDIVRIQLQHQIALLWFIQGRFSDLLQLGLTMVALAERLDHPRWRGWAHAVVGFAHTGSGRCGQALAQYWLVLANNELSGDQLNIASAHTNLGLEFYRAGQFPAAQTHLERAVALYRDSFSELRAVLALQGLGWVHLAEGNLRRAQEYADLAGGLAAEAHDRWLAECLQLTGALQTLRTEWEPAETSLKQGLEIGRLAGNIAATIDALVRLGRTFEYRGALVEALEAFREAATLADGIDVAPCAVAAHQCLGSLLLRTGEDGLGAEHIRHALALAEAMRESLEYAPALLAQAQLQQHSGDLEGALATVERAVSIPHTAEFAVVARTTHAEILLDYGRASEAEALAHAAILAAESLGAPLLLTRAYRTAGVVAAALTPARQPPHNR